MKKITCIAIVLLATCSISVGASTEDVYKCGNSYSRKPCADAVRIDVQDARTPTQKAEADANTRRETATANAMEKARLKEEAKQSAANAKWAAQIQKASAKPHATASTPMQDTTTPVGRKAKSTKKTIKKKKEPELFTASAAVQKPKTDAEVGARK